MSKSSTAALPKNLPSKSAWARGPPQPSAASSPRSQSPAPAGTASGNATPPQAISHSRRPSALGQGIPVKDGVSVARNSVAAVKAGSPVTFGSIDDASAPLSSSPAAAPPMRADASSVKSFGSVPATPTSNINGTPKSMTSTLSTSSVASSTASTTPTTPAASTSTPTHAKPKVDVRKLFQNPGAGATASPTRSNFQNSSDVISSPIRTTPSSAGLPPQPGAPPGQTQNAPQGAQPPYPPYSPQTIRTPSNNSSIPPAQRSPVFPRAMPNGSGMRQPSGPPGGPNAVPGGPGSPRLGTHQPPPPPHAMPPVHSLPPGQAPVHAQMVPGWPGHYYVPQYMPAGLPPEYMNQPYSAGGWVPGLPPPGAGQPPHPGHPGHPAHHPGGPSHMPMSPRNPSHALPPSQPQPGQPQHPPPTPTTPSNGLPSSFTSPSLSARLNTNAREFTPGVSGSRPRTITIKNSNGQELNLKDMAKTPVATTFASVSSLADDRKGASTPPATLASPAKRTPVRLETPDQKLRREADEKMAKMRAERDRKEREERERKEKEEKEKKEREEKEAEENKKKQEEEERLKKEEEAKEQERLKEAEEKERAKKEEEEKERAIKEEQERVKKEEEEKARKAAEEEAAARAAAEAEAEAEAKARAKKEQAEREREAIASASEDGQLIETNNEPHSKEKGSVPFPSSSPAPPSPDLPRSKRPIPGPLDLSSTNKPGLPLPLPSALATARIIDDLGKVPYPEGIKSPKVELNMGAKQGKFKYDRDFLMQFMAICKEKPDRLPPLDAIGLEPVEQNFPQHPMSRTNSSRRQNSISGSSTRRDSVGLGLPLGSSKGSSFGAMGDFGKLGDRFGIGAGGRAASAMQPPFQGGRPSPMTRSPSLGGPGGVPSLGGRVRSKRGTGEKRTADNRVNSNATPPMSHLPGMEPIAPLVRAKDAWVANSAAKKPVATDQDSPEVVDRKVKGLLNKLTMEKFDSISDQIITWANKSEKEKDGRTLIQVIKLVFEKATDEAAWSEMYARLCRKMMEQISTNVQDEGIRNTEGQPITGGQLFRKYLLNRCQEDFERGWAAKDAALAAAASKATSDAAAREAAETAGTGEEVLYSEEYYAAQKAKRRGLGLIRFIGELFKLQMLTERIMHACIKKLLSNVDNPEEEEIESLCKLLITVGQSLDNQKAKGHMDVYFTRMKELAKSNNVAPRMQFMLQDVIELRERKWISRNLQAAPSTLAQVHETAAKEKAAAEKETHARMSRGGSRRGGERPDSVGPDGWTVTGGPPRPAAKAGDLSKFGKIEKQTTMSFGPSSVFAGKKGDPKSTLGPSALSRTNSTSNMFAMLSQGGEVPSDKKDPAQPEEPPKRRKLNLLPRSKPVEDAKNEDSPAPSAANSDDEGDAPASPTMSDAEAKKKIEEDSKEFFAVRNVDEAEDYFTKLPAEHQHRLIDKLVSTALDRKQTDAELVADLFRRASEKELCTTAAFGDGFGQNVEMLSDIAIDVPKAFDLMAIMIKGTSLDEEQRSRLCEKSEDSDKLLTLLSS